MTTRTRPTNDSWLRRLVSGHPHQIIGTVEDPYLHRWYLIPRNGFCNLYLHKFLRDDVDTALHDHPWWFISWIIKGYYLEYTPVPGNPHPRRRWSVAYRAGTYRHRVALVNGFRKDGTYGKKPCWTVIMTGRRGRAWGFWCPHGGFVPWQQFDDAGCGE